jgi:hypothetical protein
MRAHWIKLLAESVEILYVQPFQKIQTYLMFLPAIIHFFVSLFTTAAFATVRSIVYKSGAIQ